MIITFLKRFKYRLCRFLNFLLLHRDQEYWQLSYSQEGEDLILEEVFSEKKSGFYVDIGAHHPFRFSNTYLLYKSGWRGINIDAMPGSMTPFNKYRPRDINLEIPVSEKRQELVYYMFDEPGLNGFNKTISENRLENTIYKIIDKIPLQTKPLVDILNEYMPHDVEKIDFMSIDIEGLELEVLHSNNWDKFKPEVILVETRILEWDNAMADPACAFLISKGYQPFAKNIRSVFFKRVVP